MAKRKRTRDPAGLTRYRVLLPAYAADWPEEHKALYRLSYPTNPQVIEYLVGGGRVPFKWRGEKDVAAGEIVDDIPTVSLPWLLEQGLIEEVGADG